MRRVSVRVPGVVCGWGDDSDSDEGEAEGGRSGGVGVALEVDATCARAERVNLG